MTARAFPGCAERTSSPRANSRISLAFSSERIGTVRNALRRRAVPFVADLGCRAATDSPDATGMTALARGAARKARPKMATMRALERGFSMQFTDLQELSL